MAEVDTDSLINKAIEARSQREVQRRNIGAQRRTIISQLGSANPRNKGKIHALRAQLSGLDIGDRELMSRDRNDQQLLGTQVSSAFRNANMAHKLSTDALNLQTAQQAGEVFNGFADLMSRAKPGTQAFRDGMTALKDKYPLGFAAEAVKGHLGQIAQFHDKEADQNKRKLVDALFNAHQLSPDQFAARDVTKDRLTNAPVLVDAKGNEDLKTGTPPSHDVVEAKRNANGGTAAVDIGGRTYLFSKPMYDNLNETFGSNRATDTSSTERPMTDEERAVASGYRDLNQYNQFLQTGKVVAPEGTIGDSAVQARQVATQDLIDAGRVVGSPQAAYPGGLVQPSQVGNDNRTATLPTGTQPNQTIQPVTSFSPTGLDVQPKPNVPQEAVAVQSGQPTATPAPQVAQQPTATPHPMEGQTVRNKTSGQMGTIINGVFVPNQQ